MSDKTYTLYKGEQKRRVGTAKERRQMMAAGWSEKAPQAAQQATQARVSTPAPTPAPQPTPPAVKPQPKPEDK